jgi:hypothetical protein
MHRKSGEFSRKTKNNKVIEVSLTLMVYLAIRVSAINFDMTFVEFFELGETI